MKIFCGPRQSGKTSKLVDWVYGDPDKRIIVVPNMEMGRYLREGFGLKDYQVLTYREAVPLLNGRGKVQIGIDELDAFLRHLFGRSVTVCSANPITVEMLEPWNNQ